MKRYYVLGAILVSFALMTIIGCGSAATSGGSSGGGSSDVTMYVSTLGDDTSGEGTVAKPYRTITKAMGMADTGEVICVLAGVYTEEVTWTSSPDVTLRGVDKNTVTIEVQATKRGINIPNTVASNQTITIESMTIKGARYALGSGGGINADTSGSTLHIKDMILYDNRSTGLRGGGIWFNDPTGKLVIDGCVLDSNRAQDLGSAIFATGEVYILNSNIKNNYTNNQSTVYIADGATLVYIYSSTFEGNGSAGFYSILRNKNALLTAEACSFLNNYASNGVGMFTNSNLVNTATIRNCSFTNNMGGNNSGGTAIYSEGSVVIDRCIISGNTCESWGGAVYITSNSPNAKIMNSVFTGNKVIGTTKYGGAIYFAQSGGSSLEVFNCTFVSNESTATGPAVYLTDSGGSTFANNIFQNNTGSSTAQVVYGSGLITFNNNNIPDNGLVAGVSATGSGNVTTESPVFVSIPSDMHLDSSCPVSIKQGGTTEANGFTMPSVDRDGISRTPPYSIGAYEKN
jgi:hypothetical protein